MDDPQVRALDRLDQLARRLDHAGGRKRLRQPKVRMTTAGPSALQEQVAGSLGEERPQRVQLPRPVDVDPQPAGLADRLLLPTGRRTDGRRDEHLLAASRVILGELEQRLQPPSSANTAAGEKVVAPPARRDLEAAVAP